MRDGTENIKGLLRQRQAEERLPTGAKGHLYKSALSDRREVVVLIVARLEHGCGVQL